MNKNEERYENPNDMSDKASYIIIGTIIACVICPLLLLLAFPFVFLNKNVYKIK